MNSLILMSRLPSPGHTKTRLRPEFSDEECAALHRCFLADYESCFRHVNSAVRCYCAYGTEGFEETLLSCLPANCEAFAQRGDTLAQRMDNSINAVLANGSSKVVLIGADIPHIQPDVISSSFAALDHADIVLGPTEDGGYYLIGTKNSCTAIFSETVTWGGSTVLEETCRIAEALSLRVTFAETYCDIDTYQDLQALHEMLSLKGKVMKHFPKATWNFIEARKKEVNSG